MNSNFIGMMLKEDSIKEKKVKMSLVDRYEETLSSVKVSFNKRLDRDIFTVFIGKYVADSMGVKPGDYVEVMNKGREFELRKSKKGKSSYKIQKIDPDTRNNYRIQMTWKRFKPKGSDLNIKIVGHVVNQDKSMLFCLDDGVV